MAPSRQSAYTLVLWLSLCPFTVGCGGAEDSASPAGSPSGATRSETDPEIPTVTLPEEEAGDSGSTTTDEGSPQ
jgi:hypothetical protein